MYQWCVDGTFPVQTRTTRVNVTLHKFTHAEQRDWSLRIFESDPPKLNEAHLWAELLWARYDYIFEEVLSAFIGPSPILAVGRVCIIGFNVRCAWRLRARPQVYGVGLGLRRNKYAVGQR